ncbi:MAG: hypothetical protein JNL95_03245 [Chitinophagales bacterium]|nr:hypothetical protein [Chitinophagales bacterium]
MFRILITFIFTISFGFSFAQIKRDTSYTTIPEEPPIPENVIGYRADYGWRLFINYFGYAELITDDIEAKYNKALEEGANKELKIEMTKLGLIQSKYNLYTTFPMTIADGWHKVVVTDNAHFCSDMKVLVQNNNIVKLAAEDFFPINFSAPRQIRNAKNTITIKKFYAQKLVTVDVYFMDDIEQQNIVEPPQKYGYVCFWSDIKNAEDIIIKIQDKKIGKVPLQSTTEPECFSNGMLCKILRPGQYSLLALGRGTIVWRGEFLIKENTCLKYHLGKSNKAWE